MLTISDVREFQLSLEEKVREINAGRLFRNLSGIVPKYERSLDEYEFGSFAVHDNESVTIRFNHKRSSDVLVITVSKEELS